MGRSAVVAALLAAGLLAACSPREPAADAAAEGMVDAVPPAGSDTCGAGDYAGFVGQRVDALNDAALPEGARVLFPGSAVTQDFQAERINITVGTDDRIGRVYCG